MHAKITSERFIGVGKIALGFYATHSTKMPTPNKTLKILHTVYVYQLRRKELQWAPLIQNC